MIDRTAGTRERLSWAASCLSFCRSASHAFSLPFSFHHSAATNTPFWQRLNCADTLECAGQNGRLVKAVVVYTLPRIIRGGHFSEPINHEQASYLFGEYFWHRIDVDGGEAICCKRKAADCCWSITVAMLLGSVWHSGGHRHKLFNILWAIHLLLISNVEFIGCTSPLVLGWSEIKCSR